MKINIKLLEQCPELSDYQKDLIKRVDVDGESQISVARLYKKSRSTICSQIKKARKKFVGWMKKHELSAEVDLDKYVFGRLNRGDSPKVIIADAGHSDEIITLSEKWRKLHDDDYWAARDVLNSYSLMQGFEEEKKPLAKAVESLIDWLEDVHQDLNNKESENGNLKLQLEDLNNKLSNVSNELDEAEAEIERLSRLKKYEELSEEERQALQAKIDSLKSEISDLEWKIVELEMFKTRLEREVHTLNHVKADVERDIKDNVLEHLASLQLNDVLKLYNAAVMAKIQKTIMHY